MIEFQKIYAKITKPLAIVFAAFAILIVIDYMMPRKVYTGQVQNMRKIEESRYRSSRLDPSYSYDFRISGKKIQIDEETYRKVYTDDLIEVHETSILRKITDLHHLSKPHLDLTIYVMPYTNFPLYPILFILPIVFASIKTESMLLIAARTCSIVVAFLCILVTLIW